jgi:hypothetical protein
MSHRLQILVPEDLDACIRKAAQRSRISKGEWVRRAIGAALNQPSGIGPELADPLAHLAALDAPTADIDQILAEIEAGRR